jgi:hypothetical protein
MATPAYNLRKRKRVGGQNPKGVPDGYTRLDFFNSTVNKYGKFPGLSGRAVHEKGIYVRVYKGKILLWWEKPACQIDDFVYYGDRQQDIDHCDTVMMKGGYTWHHTGQPPEEASGTMQLVPTSEHSVLSHVGGVAISQGRI